MGHFNEEIRHDGGTYDVEVDIEGNQAVIYFGASFTLRLDESNIMKLRTLLHDAGRALTLERRDTSGVWDTKVVEIEEIAERLHAEDHEVNAENEMVLAGIDAREKLKAMRMMKGTASPISNDPIDW